MIAHATSARCYSTCSKFPSRDQPFMRGLVDKHPFLRCAVHSSRARSIFMQRLRVCPVSQLRLCSPESPSCWTALVCRRNILRCLSCDGRTVYRTCVYSAQQRHLHSRQKPYVLLFGRLTGAGPYDQRGYSTSSVCGLSHPFHLF